MINLSSKIQNCFFSLCLLISSEVWPSTQIPSTNQYSFPIKILGINDFHGQISTGRYVQNEPVGGAAVLASYLKIAQKGMEHRSIITIMGDLVGASTPASSLLNDEPTILFINSLGNQYCSRDMLMNPYCNIVATVGNHEFDRGQKAMLDLIYGSNNPPTNNWISLPHYPGANYPYISANIIDKRTNEPLFPPYIIKKVDGVPVAFIGAILKNAADAMFPAHAQGVEFLDEAQAINQYIPEIKSQGAQIIVVIIHEGGNQIPYEGKTKNNTQVKGNIKHIIEQLDDNIDVVMGGHTHQFLNAYIPNHNGIPILVTQANSYSASFAEVTLQVDSQTLKASDKYAQIITAYAQKYPGTSPDSDSQELVQLAENSVASIISQYVGTLQNDLLRSGNEDGESNLGNLVADAFRTSMNTDFGITNPSGIRDDMHAGSINWGMIYSVQPFANKIVSLSISGQDLYELLEQQWMGSHIIMLQVSGLSYIYDMQKPVGQRILTIYQNGLPIDRNKLYTIATTDYLANGSAPFSTLKRATLLKVGDKDHNTLAQYIKQLPQPFSASIEGRIKSIHNETQAGLRPNLLEIA